MPASEVFFLPARGGQRLCILDRPPNGSVRGAAVFVHPWAEELNKSRRAVAEGSRALARSGWAVLRMDLFGCGDSSGEFGDATWADWTDDVALGVRWLAERSGCVPRLWGLRAGCLVIADYLARGGPGHGVVLWQPAVSGRQHLAQFLRLQAASAMLADAPRGSRTQDLRERIAQGDVVEIAGYRLAEGLVSGLERAELAFAPAVGPVHWLEVSSSEELSLLPVSASRIAKLVQGGTHVESAAVRDIAFWQTVEIAEAPALVDLTVEVLAG